MHLKHDSRGQRLDRPLIGLQRWIRAHALFYRLTLGTRVLLAVGFIPTGMVKLLGYRFAYMSPETPLGGFFETLYLSGPYWHFLGLVQVLAGMLVLLPATATLGRRRRRRGWRMSCGARGMRCGSGSIVRVPQPG